MSVQSSSAAIKNTNKAIIMANMAVPDNSYGELPSIKSRRVNEIGKKAFEETHQKRQIQIKNEEVHSRMNHI